MSRWLSFFLSFILFANWNCCFAFTKASCYLELLAGHDNVLLIESRLSSLDFKFIHAIGTRTGNYTQRAILTDGTNVVVKTAKVGDETRLEYEVAAYRLDRLLGFNRVPPTVKVLKNGKVHVVQLYVNELESVPYNFDNVKTEDLNEVLFFDTLIANEDRVRHNIGLLENNLVLFDHSESFSRASVKNYRHRIFDRMLGTYTPSYNLSKSAKEKILALKEEDIVKALSDLSLSREALESLLVRFRQLQELIK